MRKPTVGLERTLTLALAVLVDLLGAEPPDRWHPVAWLGRAIASLVRLAPARGRSTQLAAGAAIVSLVVGISVLAAKALAQLLSTWPALPRLVVAAVALKLTFSLRGLADAAQTTARCLELGRLAEARLSLRALVSRPCAELDTSQVGSAAIESTAENLCDSLVGPLLYYLLLGLPGAAAYRAVNTLDAIIGYHGPYEALGKTAARLDDLLNLLPARLSALLLVTAARLGCGDARAAWTTLGADHSRTASPNAGWPMSAAAGALHVRLEKVGHYRLGATFAPPASVDVRRAIRLYYAASALALGLAAAVGFLHSRAARRSHGQGLP